MRQRRALKDHIVIRIAADAAYTSGCAETDRIIEIIG
jgi:hypothetical protein